MIRIRQILDELRPDFDHVVKMVESGSRVLDLGCGDGRLLERLVKEKNARGMGVEIDEENVVSSIGRGLSVFQGNIDEGLKNYPDCSYDYVILNQTLQVSHKPDYVLEEMLRVGSKAIVSFPNFGYFKLMLQLLFAGKMPKSQLLPFEWYNTPNIHLFSISDFKGLCRARQWNIVREIYMADKARFLKPLKNVAPNFFAEEAIFLITKCRKS